MIQDFLKNICLITFALIGPITLPAGGIQRNLYKHSILNSREIILSSNCSLYTFPQPNAKKLTTLYAGSSLSIIRKWKLNDNNLWLRVELASNHLTDNPTKITRGWIKS